MADLASCYFCGTIEEQLTDQPLIPESLDPPADRQQTVAVCPHCAQKLDRALDPLVSYLQADDIEHGSPERSTESDTETASNSDRASDDRSQEDTGTDAPPLPGEARDVLRLLRNRSFPVDREEIESVAMSAYELGPHESADAIDALIDRGVLKERDGELRRRE